MTEFRLATQAEIEKLSKLSVSLGNIPFFKDQCIASVLAEGDDILGFAAVQSAWHAAGSWMHEDHRKQGNTYKLRNALDNELRRRGIGVYFAIPGNDFEKILFAKYGHTTEETIQVRHL